MGKINVLGFEVANLIAAGEVVDRPASVVKELIENSIDSGADRITIEARRGGVGLIRVSDNGCGIEYDDLPLAVLRHATSKIKTAGDLNEIYTLGFRGEALAAISSVSKLKIMTKMKASEYGAVLTCEGGEIIDFSEAGCADGTTVVVEDIFYNVPARRKFLKKDSTEAAAITNIVEKAALSSPEISFKYLLDGEVRFITSGNGELLDVMRVIFGRDSASKFIPADRSENGIHISGFISLPELVRPNRNMQNFFINGRYIKSLTASAAIAQAYVSRIPPDKFASCVINMGISPGAVDVNVHPSKLEVKFTNEKVVFDSIYYAVKSAVEKSTVRPDLVIDKKSSEFISEKNTVINKTEKKDYIKEHVTPSNVNNSSWVDSEMSKQLINAFVPEVKKKATQIKIDTFEKEDITISGKNGVINNSSEVKKMSEKVMPAIVEEKTVPVNISEMTAVFECAASEKNAKDEYIEANKNETVNEVPEYVIIGEAYNCYVIVQLEDRLIIFDKHAAHERIIFDELCRKMKSKIKNSQVLMFPVKVEMTEDEKDALFEYEERIKSIGFNFKAEADNKMIEITAIPEEINRDTAGKMIVDLCTRLSTSTGSAASIGDEYFESKLYQSACKAAIKGGRVYGEAHIKWICDRLLKIPEDGGSAIKTCPHGRPVAFELKKNSIERQFSRLT